MPDQLDDDLKTLIRNLPALRLIAMKKATLIAHGTGGGCRTTTPTPINWGAWKLLNDITALAGMMARACGLRHGRSTPAEALFRGVRRRRERILARTDAAKVVGLVHEARIRMDRHLTPPESRVFVGCCPSCGRELWPGEQDVDSGWMVCRCGMTLRIRDVQRTRMLELATVGTQGTAAGLCRLLASCGVRLRRNTVNQWRRRGVIRPVGRDEEGRPVFLLWDVWQAIGRHGTDT